MGALKTGDIVIVNDLIGVYAGRCDDTLTLNTVEGMRNVGSSATVTKFASAEEVAGIYAKRLLEVIKNR